MPRPMSFHIEEGLLERLEDESRSASMSVTSLVSSLLDEGLKARRFPGVVYRPGPTGRWAALVGGPGSEPSRASFDRVSDCSDP